MPDAEKFSLEQQLETALMTHDWYYGYSDDHSVWLQGDAEMSRLKSLMEAYTKEAGSKIAIALWNRWAPENRKFTEDCHVSG